MSSSMTPSVVTTANENNVRLVVVIDDKAVLYESVPCDPIVIGHCVALVEGSDEAKAEVGHAWRWPGVLRTVYWYPDEGYQDREYKVSRVGDPVVFVRLAQALVWHTLRYPRHATRLRAVRCEFHNAIAVITTAAYKEEEKQ